MAAEGMAEGAGGSAPDDLECLRIDAIVEASRVEWIEEMGASVKWPDPRSEMFSNYLRSLASEETMSISRFIFMLKAAPIDTPEGMESLIDSHNEELAEDIADPDYPARSGMTRGRLKAGLFSERAKLDAGLVTARFGAGVLNRLGFKRFLVRLSGKGGLDAAIDVLVHAGFFRVHAGPNNSDILESDGRLESFHRNYLMRLRDIATLGGK